MKCRKLVNVLSLSCSSIASASLSLMVVGCAETRASADEMTNSGELRNEEFSESVATPMDEEGQIGEEIHKIDLPWTEVEHYVSCEFGACNHVERQTFSNVSADDPRIVEAHSQFARLNLIDQEMRNDENKQSVNETLSKAREYVSAGKGDELVDLIIEFTDEAFDLRALRNAQRGSAERASILNARKEQLARLRKPLESKLEDLGGKVVTLGPIGPWLEALVPAQSVASLVEFSSVRKLDINTPGSGGKPDTYGHQRRTSMGMPSDAYRSVGIDGGYGGQNLNDIVIAIIEAEVDVYHNGVNPFHAAYEDWNGGPSRIIQAYDCSLQGLIRRCRAGEGVNSISDKTHGNLVTALATASIEQGQDPNLASIHWKTPSGIATESVVYYFLEHSRADTKLAIEDAVTLGADIINLSIGDDDSDTWCKNNSFNGVQSAYESATNAGSLLVTSAGNNHEAGSTTCDINYGATFPDSVAAAALDEVDGDIAHLNATAVAGYSSRGSFASTDQNGNTVYPFIIDMAVTGTARQYPTKGTAGTDYYHPGPSNGTSVSAPIIAGSAAILKDWARTRGGLPGNLTEDPYALRVLLSLMGDGRAALDHMLDYATGFGALRYVDFDQEIGSGAWGVQRRLMVPGQIVDWAIGTSGPESTSVKGWKFAALIDRNVYGGTPRITFSLIDKCQPGTSEFLLFQWRNYGHKARFQLAPSLMSGYFHNRCLWIRANLPADAGENVELYTADYFYTTDRVNHEAD